MKVCHLTSVHDRFDHRIFEKELASLVGAGYECRLVVADGCGEGLVAGVGIHDAGLRFKGRLRRILLTSRRVVVAARSLDADIYHLHDPELLLWAWFLRLQGAAVVYDAHESLSDQILHKAWIPRTLRRPAAVFVGGLLRILVDSSCQGCVGATRQTVAGLKSTRVAVVRNFPLLGFAGGRVPAERSGEQRLVLGYVGSISHSRGCVEMSEAVSLAAKERSVRLIIAGSAESDGIATRLHEIEEGSGGSILYRGSLGRREVRQMLSECDVGLVLLHPVPAYLEALPVKLFEYLAFGMPVIASDFAEWREVLKGYDCAVFVDPLCIVSISRAIIRMADSPQENSRMAREAQRAFRESFNWSSEERELLGFYSRLSPKDRIDCREE